MTLLRMIVVLSGGLAVMLVVVVLRAETTRLHFEVSQRERQTEGLRQQLRESELELARLRNPMLIREQVKAALQEYLQLDAPTTRPAKPEILEQLDKPPAPKTAAKKPTAARDKDRGQAKADKPKETKPAAKPAAQPRKSDRNKRKN